MQAWLARSGQADLRRGGEVVVGHAVRSKGDEPVARGGGVADERGDVDPLACRSERAQARDALVEQDARAVVVAVAPVMEPDPDLQDAVIEAADRRSRVAPQGLEGLVLLEELARVELLDAMSQRVGRRVSAARAQVLVDRATRDALRRPGRLALAASGLGLVRRRAASGSGARR